MATDDVDNMEGIEMAETEADNPLLTAEEKRVLEVYDRLEELQLEIALLKAQGVLSKSKCVKHIFGIRVDSFRYTGRSHRKGYSSSSAKPFESQGSLSITRQNY